MCDYSLENLQSRPADVGDRLVTSEFIHTNTRGFAADGENIGYNVAGDQVASVVVCLRPGTEIAFHDDVMVPGLVFGDWWPTKMRSRTARFRQINLDEPCMHHDALEFADGKIVLLNRLRAGQRATVLQLPAEPKLADAEDRYVAELADRLQAANAARAAEIDIALDHT